MSFEKKINQTTKILTAICISLAIFTISVITTPVNSKETAGDILSNKKIGWGIKRNDNHNQPDLGAENKRLIDKYNGIAMRK